MRRGGNAEKLGEDSPAAGCVLVEWDRDDATPLEDVNDLVGSPPLGDQHGPGALSLAVYELVEERITKRPMDEMDRVPIEPNGVGEELPVPEVAREHEDAG